MPICHAHGCDRPAARNGFCSMHDQRLRNYGDLEAGCRVCGASVTVHGGLCNEHEPTLCTCEVSTPCLPQEGNDHECSVCRRLVRLPGEAA